MNLHLRREPSQPWGTLGHLSIDGEPECFSLEDIVRDGPKIMHQTAIPAGRYRVIISYSLRFGKMLPLLLDVPNFTGVRIHAGNFSKDSSGCVLVGLGRIPNGVNRSREAMDRLLPQLATALAGGEQVWITIEDADV